MPYFPVRSSSGRNRRAGLCDGENTYFGKTAELVGAVTRQPLPAGRAEDRQLPDHAGGSLGGADRRVGIFRGDPILTTLQFALVLTVAAIPVAMPTVLSVTMAVGARLLAREAGNREQTGRDRRTGRRRRAVRGQDRHPDAEQADLGRSVLRE